MIPNSISTITAHLNLCIFTLFLLSRTSFGIDHHYEACAPRNCGQGNNSISYPFYIRVQQEPYCGFPGFELNCTDNDGSYPRIRISENDYIVEEIHYNNQSFRVSNAAVSSNSATGCFPRIHNITVETYSVFSLGNVSNLVLFSDCQERLSERLMSYTNIGCNVSSRAANSSLAMPENDGNIGLAEAECKEKVVAPVELYGGDGRNRNGGWNYYQELLRRGFLLNWTASDCSVCAASGGRCGFNSSSLHFLCLCRDRPHSRRCKPRKRKVKPIVAAAIGSALIITICVVCIMIRHRYKWISISSYISTKNSPQDLESASVHYGVPVFSYSELEEATHKFDPSKELGDGGFGAVYYGKLRDGREVAVKRLYEHNYKRVEQFMNEVKILTLLRHPNLVLLYGCTSHRSRELLLVYEYIPNGTVADHLHGDRAKSSPLTWPIRMNIAVETASALAYLHASDVIHRDVKSNNILLDENYCVKVADFGLSRLFPNDVSHISTSPQGTPGYVDPEYHQCYQLTDKSDVYSFGVVLVELISSMPAVDISRHRHEINLSNLAINRIQKCAFDELIDPSLGYGSNESVNRMTTSVAELAFRCLQFDKEMRPAMDEVLAVLKEIQAEVTKETTDTTEESKSVKPHPSPESEDVVLLKNVRFPPSSPISVTGKWHSGSSTTPYTSV